MSLPLWISLFVLLFALTAGMVHVFLRFRRLWRTFKTFVSASDGAFQDLTDRLERLAANAESFTARTPRLEASLERLGRSLARAAVLRAALKDVQDSVGRVTAVYPHK